MSNIPQSGYSQHQWLHTYFVNLLRSTAGLPSPQALSESAEAGPVTPKVHWFVSYQTSPELDPKLSEDVAQYKSAHPRTSQHMQGSLAHALRLSNAAQLSMYFVFGINVATDLNTYNDEAPVRHSNGFEDNQFKKFPTIT
ncbi:hypothetical protein N7465_001581 [Penicillium sp. CMV-2018d]|nr:hypothetical protein N7465_001581 [Penicillium sp. CMV-2018d]